MTFGARLRELREGRNLSLRGLGKRLGVCHTRLCQLERGDLKRLRPSEELVARIAAEFGEDGLELLRLAGRLPSAVEGWVLADADLYQALERARRAGLDGGDFAEFVAVVAANEPAEPHGGWPAEGLCPVCFHARHGGRCGVDMGHYQGKCSCDPGAAGDPDPSARGR